MTVKQWKETIGAIPTLVVELMNESGMAVEDEHAYGLHDGRVAHLFDRRGRFAGRIELKLHAEHGAHHGHSH